MWDSEAASEASDPGKGWLQSRAAPRGLRPCVSEFRWKSFSGLVCPPDDAE